MTSCVSSPPVAPVKTVAAVRASNPRTAIPPSGLWPMDAWTRPANRPVTCPAILDGRIRFENRACSPPTTPQTSLKAIRTAATHPAGTCQADSALSSSEDRKAKATAATSVQWSRRTPGSQTFTVLIEGVGWADMADLRSDGNLQVETDDALTPGPRFRRRHCTLWRAPTTESPRERQRTAVRRRRCRGRGAILMGWSRFSELLASLDLAADRGAAAYGYSLLTAATKIGPGLSGLMTGSLRDLDGPWPSLP